MADTRVDSYSDDRGVEGALYRELRRFIGDATDRLWIKVPWWDTSPHAKELLDDVVKARGRRVDVTVLARPESSNDAVLRRLRDAGVKVVCIRNLHEKHVLADDRALDHSTNFTRKELAVNENSGTILRGQSTVGAIEAGFQVMIENQAKFAVGEEVWTSTAKLVPKQLTPYLDRYARLNPLQSKAVPAVLTTTGHVMVVAPTSSGKTLIGEVAALRSIILEDRPAVWLLPARALAKEVAETAERWQRLGIKSVELTGETNLSSERVRSAQLWVATTEKFESLYRRRSLSSFLDTVGCLIVDEVHLVGDQERGATLESLIARLRTSEGRTRIVALSATVANAQELARWFNAELISSTWRPTRLVTQLVAYDTDSNGPGRWADEKAKDEAVSRLLDELRAGADSAESDDPIGNLLIFCGSKNAVRRTAAHLGEFDRRDLPDESLVELAGRRKIGIYFRDAPHASRTLKGFKDRQLTTLVATSGLSTGVNTPARVVVIRDLVLGISDLEVSQAQQMLGRAGRAGLEQDGFGFILVPRDEEDEWRQQLTAGYRVRSQLLDKVADAVLAEILLGSITSYQDARIWYEGTFAYAQTTTPHDMVAVVDRLIQAALVSGSNGQLRVTDVGALTARLMVGVDAAEGLYSQIPKLTPPSSATEAEEIILGLAAKTVPALREWPVNPKAYGDWVDDALAASGSLGSRAGVEFGSRFIAAVASAALNQPARLQVSGTRMARSELTRAIEAIPRYLSWIAGLGSIGVGSWEPAVAGDLARRLTWWHLDPQPERGTGRLLWFLELLLEPENRRRRMPNLWNRARNAGFDHPNGINAAPRGVDAAADRFGEVVRTRAHLVLGPPDGLTVDVSVAPEASRLLIATTDGLTPTIIETQGYSRRMDLPTPPRTRSNELAADLLLYARGGDFAYQNLTTEIPEGTSAFNAAEVAEDAKKLVCKLKPSTAFVSPPGRVRRLFQSQSKRTLNELFPQMAPDRNLLPIAHVLVGDETSTESVLVRIRDTLEVLLPPPKQDVSSIRSATAILKSGYANAREFECVILAIAGTLEIEVGAAQTRNGQLVGLVNTGHEWHILTPLDDTSDVVSKPLVPDTLPALLTPLDGTSVRLVAPARPRYPWLDAFAPGSGEPSTFRPAYPRTRTPDSDPEPSAPVQNPPAPVPAPTLAARADIIATPQFIGSESEDQDHESDDDDDEGEWAEDDAFDVARVL